MKKQLLFASAMVFLSLASWAQEKPVKIVFDVTSKDTLTHQTVLRHVSGMAKSYPESQFEVVVYGGALPMLMQNKSTIDKGLADLATNKNVAFKACAGTMKRLNVDKSQLLPGIEVVPDAIIEIVNKQGQGWGYIKEQ